MGAGVGAEGSRRDREPSPAMIPGRVGVNLEDRLVAWPREEGVRKVETWRRVGRCWMARVRRSQVNKSRPGRGHRRQHNVRVASSPRWGR